MRVLTVNAGSSSLKLRVLDHDDRVEGTADADRDGDLGGQLRDLLDRTGPVDAVSHRVVHGGHRHVQPEPVTDDLVADLDSLTPLAPLHQPVALDGMRAAAAALPDVPGVACFDTAFHAHLPPAAATYAVPEYWRTRLGVRRFGAHGLSYAYAARRVTTLVGGPVRRLVVAHLGSGASVCAIEDGRSVDTSMGFTPMEGVVMATRSGTVDPGLVLWLVRDGGLSVAEVSDGLDRNGGLLALAGTKDMKEVVQRAADGDKPAGLALDVTVHRLSGELARMAAALGGVDALVFTGGVGERSSVLRARVVERLGFLGAAVDVARNDAAGTDVEVTAHGSRVRTFVLEAREDLELACDARSLLGD
jgi:acetate kinase